MFGLGPLGGLLSGPKAQTSGKILRPSRRSSLFGCRQWNAKTISPPESKRERIEAGRRKLVQKSRRSAERSARDKAKNARRSA